MSVFHKNSRFISFIKRIDTQPCIVNENENMRDGWSSLCSMGGGCSSAPLVIHLWMSYVICILVFWRGGGGRMMWDSLWLFRWFLCHEKLVPSRCGWWIVARSFDHSCIFLRHFLWSRYGVFYPFFEPSSEKPRFRPITLRRNRSKLYITEVS